MDKDEDLQNLWNWHSDILSRRGIDVTLALKQIASHQHEQLSSPGARIDFAELCTNGCVPELLALLVIFLRWSPQLEGFWAKVYGSPDRRHRASKSLEKAAEAIEDLFAFTIGVEDDELVRNFESIDHVSPGRLASELRVYGRVLELLNRIPREAKMRSLSDFVKFLLTEYVKLATGRFRDRNVSGIIAEVVGPVDYNEVAHRMWRSRNYKRMNSHFQKLSELLAAIQGLATSRNVTNS